MDNLKRVFTRRRRVLLLSYLGAIMFFGALIDIEGTCFIAPTMLFMLIFIISLIHVLDASDVSLSAADVAKLSGIIFLPGLIVSYVCNLLDLCALSTLSLFVTSLSAIPLVITLCIMFAEWAENGD